MRRGVFLLVLGLLPPVGPAAAPLEELTPLSGGTLEETLEGEQWDRNAPVDIHSDKMSVDFERHRIEFIGNVKVHQGDFSLNADRVTALFEEGAEDISRIIAEGNVTIRKGDKSAWGQRAVYDRKKAIIVLTGEPVLSQGRNCIRGEEIRVRLNEDRMEIEGKVKAEFLLSGERGGTADHNKEE